jgi:hypothetical protein
MMGEISEALYDSIELPYKEFMIEYTSLTGRRQYIMPALLRAERFLSGHTKGRDIYSALMDYGFSQRISLSAIRLFAANDLFVDSLLSREVSYEESTYSMNYMERMKRLGIEAITIRPDYAFENELYVRPIRVIVPPPVGYWRTSMAYAYAERRKGSERIAEIRIWHQDFGEERNEGEVKSELHRKWDEAMDILYNDSDLPAGLSDVLSTISEVGMEINEPIDQSDLVGEVCTWYGRAIFWRGNSERYFYDIFKNMTPQKEPLLKKTYKEYGQTNILSWVK